MEYDDVTPHEFVCEVCDKHETLTDQQAYMNGWDYPPFIGAWGIISPRTCPNCDMIATAYWTLMTRGGEELTDKHRATILRIIEEAGTPYATAG